MLLRDRSNPQWLRELSQSEVLVVLVDSQSELDVESVHDDVWLVLFLALSFPLLSFPHLGSLRAFLSELSSKMLSMGGLLDFSFLLARLPFPRGFPSGLLLLGRGGVRPPAVSTFSHPNASTKLSLTRYCLNRNMGVIPFVWRVYQNVRREWHRSSFSVDGSPRTDSKCDGRCSSSTQSRMHGTSFFHGIAWSEPEASATTSQSAM